MNTPIIFVRKWYSDIICRLQSLPLYVPIKWWHHNTDCLVLTADRSKIRPFTVVFKSLRPLAQKLNFCGKMIKLGLKLCHISLLCSKNIVSCKCFLWSLNNKIFCAFLILEAKNNQFFSNFKAENMSKIRGLSVAGRAKIVTLNEEGYSEVKMANFKKIKV